MADIHAGKISSSVKVLTQKWRIFYAPWQLTEMWISNKMPLKRLKLLVLRWKKKKISYRFSDNQPSGNNLVWKFFPKMSVSKFPKAWIICIRENINFIVRIISGQYGKLKLDKHFFLYDAKWKGIQEYNYVMLLKNSSLSFWSVLRLFASQFLSDDK